MNNQIADIIIEDKRITTPYSTWWVVDAGIKEGYEYPCVMVEILHEIEQMQAHGYEINIIDKRTKK